MLLSYVNMVKNEKISLRSETEYICSQNLMIIIASMVRIMQYHIRFDSRFVILVISFPAFTQNTASTQNTFLI